MNRTVCLTAASVLLAGAAHAELPDVTLKMVGITSNNVMYTQGEVPFFTETLPQMSKGAISVDLVPHDQLGLKGTELLRLLKNGSLEFAAGNLSYMAPDSPKFEGLDLAGLTLTLEEARAVAEAYKPVLEELMAQTWNIKLLALAPNPPQVFWCRDPIGGVNDLAGKKIRVFNQTLSDFVEGAGGTTVTMPFVDVIPALQRGVADCAVTGTLSGNTASWWEVTSHLYPMTVGWSIMFWAVNQDTWESYSPELQAFLTDAFAQFEDKAWQIGAQATAEGIACNAAEGACEIGIVAEQPMTVVPVADEHMAKHGEILRDYVVANWAERCGAECAAEWNETIGKVVGVEAPTEF